MWPALALVLLMAGVWYFAGSSGAHAQTTTPEMTLTPRWQWMGDTVTLSASGFTPGVRAWAHVSWSPDEIPTCRDVSVVANQVGDDLVVDDGTVSFTLTVAPPGFQAGDHNYLCLVDREGLGIDLRPERLCVVEPPPVYRMRLDVTAIEQAPNSAYIGTGSMPDNFAVVDGRHSDNWNLPQRRGFFASSQPGSDNVDYGIDGVDSAGSGFVVIPAGETEATITVRVVDDDIVEPALSETVIARLSDLETYNAPSTPPGYSAHTLHIQDNDALHVGTNALPLVTFAQISQRVGEDVGTRRVTVNLSPASRVPGLVVLNGEEVVRRIGSGQVVFVTQVQDAQLATGAHPRVRGNRAGIRAGVCPDGSIPARAGEPPWRWPGPARSRVYPRACGGTQQPRQG